MSLINGPHIIVKFLHRRFERHLFKRENSLIVCKIVRRKFILHTQWKAEYRTVRIAASHVHLWSIFSHRTALRGGNCML